jgi:phosphate acetyltransferase
VADATAKVAVAAGAVAVQALMKASTPMYCSMRQLRMLRLLSHCAIMPGLTYARRINISDVALNIAPDIDRTPE